MNLIRWLKRRIRNSISTLVEQEVHKVVEQEIIPLTWQLVQYENSEMQDRLSYYDHTKAPLENSIFYASLRNELLAISLPVQDVEIDIADFEKWMQEYPEIKAHYQNVGDVVIEKCLEHYLSFRHLNISPNSIYLDLAAAASPFAEVLKRKGFRSYRLDFAYPDGVHGDNIGASVDDTKLPNEFASALSMQSGFECLMGDADIRFVKEAARILNKNGRYGVVPLFLDDHYLVAVSPHHTYNDFVVDAGAKKVWRDDEYNSFLRVYSPEAFKKRIYDNIPETMTGKIFYFRNLPDIMKQYPRQRLYCFFMFYCAMNGQTEDTPATSAQTEESTV